MKRIFYYLILLLILDTLTTVYLLEYVPNTIEINPLLNQFSNVIGAVVVSHVISIFIVMTIGIRYNKIVSETKKRLDLFLKFIVGFYVVIVSLNVVNIVISHYYLI